ncbi:unnamed protein product [Cuscuta campestris]|uniref:Ty3 transposon capsid-like protein domain-containing protein n=1 Tax=Cuscuta campestris TaxID=132261 RepID=A0A484MUH1_9ASTE|nr:unnamed protein product [Cuscuta campestris]
MFVSIGALIALIMSQETGRDDEVVALKKSVNQMQQDLEQRFACLEALILASSSSHSDTPSGSRGPHSDGESGTKTGGYVPRPKLESPKCDGSDPLRWLYKVKEYFAFYATPPDERLRCVALMLEGAAADWFQWRSTNGLLHGWEDFVAKFRQRFDPLHYVDYFGQLAKLRQRGSVMDYQTEYERILQHVTGASEEVLISLFHAGLKPHLQQEIVLLKPQSLSDSFALARELEAKHTALISAVAQRPTSGINVPSNRGPFQGPPSTAGLLPTPKKTPGESIPKAPVRRLTRAERLEKDAKGP